MPIGLKVTLTSLAIFIGMGVMLTVAEDGFKDKTSLRTKILRRLTEASFLGMISGFVIHIWS